MGPNLKFTNHWIGIYDPRGPNLMPAKRMVKDLQPALAQEGSANGMIIPAEPASLAPVYAKAVTERERESGPESAKVVAQGAADMKRILGEGGSERLPAIPPGTKRPQPAPKSAQLEKEEAGVSVFRTEAGGEPVREWLKGLPAREDRRRIGYDIETVEDLKLARARKRKHERGLP